MTTVLLSKKCLLFAIGMIVTGSSLGVAVVVSGVFNEGEDAEHYLHLGSTESAERHYLKAIEYYDKSIELDPGIAEVYNNRGLAYESMADYGKAIENYDQAIQLDPNYADAYYNRARAYNPDEVHSMSSLNLYMEGEAHWREPDLDKELQAEIQSLDDYVRAIELDPSYLQRVPCGASALWTFLKEGGDLEQPYASALDTQESYFGYITKGSGDDLADEYFGSWSPDGKRIAFVRRESPENGDIWVLDFDTGDRTRLTSSPIDESGPAWSPDGKRIAYRTSESGTEAIWVMNSDGSNKSRLVGGLGAILDVSWAPSGERIAFYRWEKREEQSTPDSGPDSERCPRCSSGDSKSIYEIWVMDDNGNGQQVAAHDADFSGFSWSPDGTKIVYAYPQPEVAVPASRHIFVVNIETNQRSQLTSGDTDNIDPVWSPDGQRIIFQSQELPASGHYDICLMNEDGSDRACSNATSATSPSINDLTWYTWNSTEKEIIYTAPEDIWIVDLNGGDKKKVQLDSEVYSSFNGISWSPDRRKIAFGGKSDSGHRGFYVVRIEERSASSTPVGSGPTCMLHTSVPAPSNPLPTNSTTGKIAFESETDGNEQIYSMKADGTGLKRLTTTPASDMFPRWSPNGQSIVFQSDRDGDWEVYVMAADGGNQVDLSQAPGDDFAPAWSPDGSLLAFTKAISADNWEIYLMNADGTGQTCLTNDPHKDGTPAWSPDGSRIAFFSDRDGNWEIYVMNADGTGETRLTSNPATDGAPAWSPDGSKIAFFSDRDGNNEIYTMNADGTGQTRLTYDPAKDGGPDWSPDGSKIAFTSDRDGNAEIYVMNADGSHQINITNNPANDIGPRWSPVSPSPTTEQTTGHR